MDRRYKKIKAKVIDKISSTELIPRVVMDKSLYMEVVSNREISIDFPCSILNYTDEIIVLNTKEYPITIKGRQLSIKGISTGNMVISGYIEAVLFN